MFTCVRQAKPLPSRAMAEALSNSSPIWLPWRLP